MATDRQQSKNQPKGGTIATRFKNPVVMVPPLAGPARKGLRPNLLLLLLLLLRSSSPAHRHWCPLWCPLNLGVCRIYSIFVVVCTSKMAGALPPRKHVSTTHTHIHTYTNGRNPNQHRWAIGQMDDETDQGTILFASPRVSPIYALLGACGGSA